VVRILKVRASGAKMPYSVKIASFLLLRKLSGLTFLRRKRVKSKNPAKGRAAFLSIAD
jgi:hypothetical protein